MRFYKNSLSIIMILIFIDPLASLPTSQSILQGQPYEVNGQVSPMHININSTNIAVNSVTNKVYVVNLLNTIPQTSVVSVIDGASNKLKYTIPLQWDYTSCPNIPYMQNIAVNSVTNKVYVVNPLDTITQFSGVSVIDGASNK